MSGADLKKGYDPEGKPLQWYNPHSNPRTTTSGPLSIAGMDLGPVSALYNGMDTAPAVKIGHYGALTCNVRPSENKAASSHRWGWR